MTTSRSELSSRRGILIVDDEPMVRLLMRRALADEPFELDEAADGREALERFMAAPGRYRAVIIDVMMPRMAGDETARHMRALDPHVRIIATSGFFDLDEASRAYIDSFLPKPFRPMELHDRLLALLAADPTAAEPGGEVSDVLMHVEDNPTDATVARRALASGGFKGVIMHAHDGQDAVDKLIGGARPRLVLLDMKLPRRSGLEVLSWLRQSSTPTMPVVTLTSSEWAAEVEQARALKVSAYLVKPFSPRALRPMMAAVASFYDGLATNPNARFPAVEGALTGF